MSTYGERLEQAMALAGITSQAELGRAIGSTRATINQVIGGQTNCLKATYSALAARVLDVDHYWLATGEGEPRIPLMSERMALSAKAVYIGERLDAISDPEQRARAYALIVQVLDFGGPPPTPPPGA